MNRKKLNNADKTLIFSGIVFIISFLLNIKFSHSWWTECLLFCSEAAVVGGIADWFAVTALFEKPLGFPYHTAILPQRRIEFIAACVKMVQTEFFTRKRLVTIVKKRHWREKLLTMLMDVRLKDYLSHKLWKQVKSYILTKDLQTAKKTIKSILGNTIRSIDADTIFSEFVQKIKSSGHDQEIISYLAERLLPMAESETTRKKIEKMLTDYQKERTAGSMLSFFASLAMATNIINFSEAAETAQHCLVRMLKQLAVIGSSSQQNLLNSIYNVLEAPEKASDFVAFITKMREELLNDSCLDEAIDLAAEHLLMQFREPSNMLLVPDSKIRSLEEIFTDIFYAEYDRFCRQLQTDDLIKGKVEELTYDLAARTVIKGQEMLGKIVSTVLGQMSEERINSLVRDKIEPDLIWIRINGSVVGTIIGLVFFVVLTLIRSVIVIG